MSNGIEVHTYNGMLLGENYENYGFMELKKIW